MQLPSDALRSYVENVSQTAVTASGEGHGTVVRHANALP